MHSSDSGQREHGRLKSLPVYLPARFRQQSTSLQKSLPAFALMIYAWQQCLVERAALAKDSRIRDGRRRVNCLLPLSCSSTPTNKVQSPNPALGLARVLKSSFSKSTPRTTMDHELRSHAYSREGRHFQKSPVYYNLFVS